jgi:hypothetical protein
LTVIWAVILAGLLTPNFDKVKDAQKSTLNFTNKKTILHQPILIDKWVVSQCSSHIVYINRAASLAI